MDLIRIIREQLKDDLLPGNKAHQGFSPPHRTVPSKEELRKLKAQPAAVLIHLFYNESDRLSTILMQRNKYPGVHSNQISFPGGRIEKSDKDAVDAALRESEEEVSLSRTECVICGELSPLYIPPSNFIVTPIVSVGGNIPNGLRKSEEAVDIFTPEINHFFQKENQQIKELEVRGHRFSTPCFMIEDTIIWGATAMILNELLGVIQSIPAYDEVVLRRK